MAKFEATQKDQQEQTKRRLGIEDHLLQLLKLWSHAEKRNGRSGASPEPLPHSFDEAVHAFIKLYQPPRQPDEAVQQTTWGEIDPYLTRLKSTFIAFLNLPLDGRRFVRAAIEDGVEWRGDDLDRFARVYEETMRARQMGIEAYRTEAIANAKKKLGLRIPG